MIPDEIEFQKITLDQIDPDLWDKYVYANKAPSTNFAWPPQSPPLAPVEERVRAFREAAVAAGIRTIGFAVRDGEECSLHGHVYPIEAQHGVALSVLREQNALHDHVKETSYTPGTWVMETHPPHQVVIDLLDEHGLTGDDVIREPFGVLALTIFDEDPLASDISGIVWLDLLTGEIYFVGSKVQRTWTNVEQGDQGLPPLTNPAHNLVDHLRTILAP